MIHRRSRKILSLLLTVALMAALLPNITAPTQAVGPSGSWADYATDEPSNDGTTFTIASAEELAWVAAQVNGNINYFIDCTIILGDTIDLSAHYWVPIGAASAFLGNFDGNGYTISGLTIADSTIQYAGLIGYAINGSIADVTLTDVSIQSTYDSAFGYAGGLVGYSRDPITNCSVTGSVALSSDNTYAYCGGLVGKEENGAITDCSASGSVTASMSAMETYCGGLAGDILLGSVSDCASSAAVGTSAVYVGGLAGRLYNTPVTESSSTGTVNNTNIMAFTGGFVGQAYSNGSSSSINDSHASGAVTQGDSSGSVGGFGGFCANYTVSGCNASGDVTGGTEAGGFMGNSESAVTDCYATGSVTISGSNPYSYGGFIGYNAGAVTRCYATGAVQGGTLVGGFVGSASGSGSIALSYSTGTVSGSNRAGGFAGVISGTVSDCYSTGSVTSGNYSGGFVGSNSGSDIRCYCAGAVTGTYPGGFVGVDFGSETDCYWLSGTASAAVGGTEYGSTTTTVTEMTSAEMSASSFSETLNDGRTEAPWITLAGVNCGYPVLHGVGEGIYTETYAVTGTITSAAPSILVDGLTVGLYASTATDYSGAPLYSAQTESDGSYSIGGVAVGSYVAVVAADVGGAYAQSKSAPFAVSAAINVDAIALNILCTISGTVTLPDGTTPAPGVSVKLYNFDFSTGDLTYRSGTTADGSGNYTLSLGVADSGMHFYAVFASSYTVGDKTYTDNAGLAIVSLNTATIYDVDISLVDLGDSWLGHAVKPSGYTEGDTTITIRTPAELAWLAQQSALYLESFEGVTINLAASLDLSGYNWAAICPEKGFAGAFNGNGHVISNLSANIYYDTSNSSLYSQGVAGLFGDIEGGTVRDLGLVDVSISLRTNDPDISDLSAGALAGYAYNATIERCYSTGSVSTSVLRSLAGGLIGMVYDSSISQCYSECSVSGTYGYIESKLGFGGGLLGYIGDDVSDTIPIVVDCYATGSVSGTCQNNGGLIGCYFGAVTIANSYATGSVSNATNNGSFTGFGLTTGSISNIHWLESGLPGVADGGAGDLALDCGKSSDDMTTEAFADILNSDTDTTDPWMWYAEINGGYPVLNGVGAGDNSPEAPTVTIDPANATVTEGQIASFTAAADGHPAPTVKWQVSTNDGTSFSDIDGANAATYSFTAALADDGKQFRAVFTNAEGTATSSAATLTVNQAPAAPTITTHPSSTTVTEGQTARFTAAAGGYPTPTVKWQVSTNGGTSFSDIDDANAAAYSFTATLGDDGKQFRAVFTNLSGMAASDAATLTVVPDTAVPVRSVRVSPATISLKIGQSSQLGATISPSNATNQSVSWTSSNPRIAAVDGNGLVRALRAGLTTITVTTEDGEYTSRCLVSVTKPITVESVGIEPGNLTIIAGQTKALKAVIEPYNATNKTVIWSSSNPSVATVDATGSVTGLMRGTATIKVRTADGGKTATCKVTVNNPVAVRGVTLNRTNLNLIVSDTAALIATITPKDATNTSVTWSSDNLAAATVDRNGVVTAVGPGTARIAVETADGGYAATCTVTVKTNVRVTGVTLNKTSLTLRMGRTTSLVATIMPSDAENKNVVWTTSNSNAARVDQNGKVTACGIGTTRITVTAKDGGYTATCLIVVVKK